MTHMIRRLLAACVLALGVTAAVAPGAMASAATQDGWVRLAHLSPNAPAVDVYLYSLGNSNAVIVLHHVSYGTVSTYETVAAGEYTVAMRAAGKPASSPPVLSTSIDVQAGHAYTVAGMGLAANLRLQVIDDVLTTPAGRSLVRVIQASMKQTKVTVTAGSQVLARNLAFGSVTSYESVAPGTWSVHVTGSSMSASKSVVLTAATTHTLVVLDTPDGLQIDDLTDAAGSNLMPVGGASTGFGGMAPRPGSSPAPWLAVLAAGGLLTIGGTLRLRRSRVQGSRAR